MAIVLALPKLFDDVVALFASEGAPLASVGVPVPNLFGWRANAQKLTTGPRIVWIPGGSNGELGELVAPRNVGANPRPLGNLEELFTVEITGGDSTGLEDERKQYQAARVLFDAWYRAVYRSARGNLRVISTEWITDKKERRHGAAIRVVCAVLAVIPDTAASTAPVDTSADLDVEELDVTENLTVAAGA